MSLFSVATGAPSAVAGVQGAQTRPSVSTAVTLLTATPYFRYPGVGTAVPRGSVDYITVVNTSGGTAGYTIYHDRDGAVYDAGTMITGSAVKIKSGQTHFVELNIAFSNINGTIGVQTSVVSALTFTAYTRNLGSS